MELFLSWENIIPCPGRACGLIVSMSLLYVYVARSILLPGRACGLIVSMSLLYVYVALSILLPGRACATTFPARCMCEVMGVIINE